MSDFSINLSGQAAIVTGAGAGIGRAVARALASAGARVMLNDLNPDRCDELVADIRASGGIAVANQGDVSNRFQAAALIEQARDTFGRIHILVNAAGIYKAEPMTKVDEWDWRRQLDVNLTGTFFCTQLMSRVMADEGGGTIVNVASTAGHGLTLPSGIGYVATKAGVIGLTQQAARELAPYGVRVNAVCLGNIAEEEPLIASQPNNALRRLGTLDEASAVILFLCTSAASFIIGQSLVVDGGETVV